MTRSINLEVAANSKFIRIGCRMQFEQLSLKKQLHLTPSFPPPFYPSLLNPFPQVSLVLSWLLSSLDLIMFSFLSPSWQRDHQLVISCYTSHTPLSNGVHKKWQHIHCDNQFYPVKIMINDWYIHERERKRERIIMLSDNCFFRDNCSNCPTAPSWMAHCSCINLHLDKDRIINNKTSLH